MQRCIKGYIKGYIKVYKGVYKDVYMGVYSLLVYFAFSEFSEGALLNEDKWRGLSMTKKSQRGGEWRGFSTSDEV